MFSIHTASTGPSNSSHCLSGRVSWAASLKALASTPSFHSWLHRRDVAQIEPESCFMLEKRLDNQSLMAAHAKGKTDQPRMTLKGQLAKQYMQKGEGSHYS
jgi:hypothetical protein